jgi:hypothetical protein
MDRDDLEHSWRVTRQHLEAARGDLPLQLPLLDEGWSIRRYEEWLSHNELELALDELEGIGHWIGCGAGFWTKLLAAAESMTLTDHAARCRRKLAELRAKSQPD